MDLHTEDKAPENTIIFESATWYLAPMEVFKEVTQFNEIVNSTLIPEPERYSQ